MSQRNLRPWPLIKGALFKIYCWMFYPNIKVGRRVRVSIWPKIIGPGHIGIGDKVCFVDNHGGRAYLFTYKKGASISIGSGTVVGGTHILCSQSVRIGAKSLLGMATIMDTDIVPCDDETALRQFRHPTPAPVNLGDNVWLGTFAIVTKGVQLASDSVVGAGAVVFDSSEAKNTLLIGNPARRVGGLF